jgi:ceramide glucosyltransferase
VRPGLHSHEWIYVLAVVRSILLTLCLSATAFYAYAIYVARDFLRRPNRRATPGFEPPVSVLKPLRGLDPNAVDSFASFCRQDYGSWEMLFGAEDENEPALEAARQVARDYPDLPIRILVGNGIAGENPKVRLLSRLVREAKYPVLLVSDSDIRAGRTHLKRMVEPLADPRVGVVTCLYRSEAESLIGWIDALSLSTDFVPGALVARKLEGMSFAMGAGILIRREVLEEIGGFEAVAESLADDYLLGKLPAKAGHVVELARDVVDHRLGTSTLRELGHRQIRWNLGIRTSRPWSYAGLVFTHGTAAAALLLLATGGSVLGWSAAGATIAVRLAAARFITSRCLEDRSIAKYLWLVPIRDLLGTYFWLAAFFGKTVVWRGRRLRLGDGGRILGAAS